ncbi:MAG: hypothetical protein QOE65_1651 [Solirubrobacteraceae bacterium]|jgi:hypothetical protein|nr:hypothetical protein [Solirubrobacteraceae bacterium]
MRRALSVLVVTACVGAVPAGSAAAAPAQTPEGLANALRNDPVFADPDAKPTLTPAEAGHVRLEIVAKDLGRIKIAVVTTATAGAQGGVRGLADAIDQHLQTRGTLMVIAADNAWLTTSYDRPQLAVAAVRRAFARDDSLEQQLIRAVDGISGVDPGPSGDTSGSAPPEVVHATKGFFDTLAVILWVVGGIIALPFLFGAFALARWLWRASRRRREAVVDTRADTQDRLVELGDRIRELDAEGGTFANDPAGQTAYQGALDAYDRVERLLAEADSPERLARVNAALDEGQRQVAVAKSRVPAAAPAPPSVETQHDQANQAFGRD